MTGSIVAFPLNNYATGSRTTAPHTIPGQISTVTFAVARCTTADPTIWPNQSTTLEAILEVSEDGGATWNPHGSFTAEGGIAPGRFGGEAAESSGVFPFPGLASVDARLTLTVAGGPLRSFGTLRWA